MARSKAAKSSFFGGKSQKESRIALVNDREHRLIASMREAMSIPSAYLSLNHRQEKHDEFLHIVFLFNSIFQRAKVTKKADITTT